MNKPPSIVISLTHSPGPQYASGTVANRTRFVAMADEPNTICDQTAISYLVTFPTEMPLSDYLQFKSMLARGRERGQ